MYDNTLSLNAGTVRIAKASFRPEFRYHLDGHATGENHLSLAPKLFYQAINGTGDCGTGIDFGTNFTSHDGQLAVNINAGLNKASGSTQSSLELRVNYNF